MMDLIANPPQNTIVMEFHISRKAQDLYQFDDALFTSAKCHPPKLP
jgi:hypothetical protein